MDNWERDDDEEMRRRQAEADKENETATANSQEAGGDASANASRITGQRRKRMALSDSQLLSSQGLKKIYRTFPYQVIGAVAGNEAKALSSLMTMYKEWAYDLYPGLAFEDFLERTEILGKGHAIQGLLSDLRKEESKRGLHESDEEPEDTEQTDQPTPTDQLAPTDMQLRNTFDLPQEQGVLAPRTTNQPDTSDTF